MQSDTVMMVVEFVRSLPDNLLPMIGKWAADAPVDEFMESLAEAVSATEYVEQMMKAATSALTWLENAPVNYSNGVAHNGVDEGSVRGWEGHTAVVNELRAALGMISLREQQEGLANNDYDIPF